MNGSRFPKMRAGESTPTLSASAWNVLMDVAEYYERDIKHRQTSTPKPPPFERRNCVVVKNDTGSMVREGGILAVTGSIFDPVKTIQRDQYRSEPIFIGTEPEIPNDIGYFAVLQEPLADGEAGWAAIDGVVSCTIDMPYQHFKYADIIDGETTKLKGLTYGGAEIVHVEGQDDDPEEWTAGDKLALVRIGAFHNPILRYKLTEPLVAGSPATATRSLQLADGTWTDGDSPDHDEELYPDMFYSGSIAADSYVLAYHNRSTGLLNLIQGPCAST